MKKDLDDAVRAVAIDSKNKSRHIANLIMKEAQISYHF
jgi:hypothetical protein